MADIWLDLGQMAPPRSVLAVVRRALIVVLYRVGGLQTDGGAPDRLPELTITHTHTHTRSGGIEKPERACSERAALLAAFNGGA